MPAKNTDHIEEILAHQEKQIQDLSEVIAKQWDEIDMLKKRLGKMLDKINVIEDSVQTADGEGLSVTQQAARDKPPHY